MTAIEETAPRRYGFRRVTWCFRALVLRLEQVHVPASRHVERMPIRAEIATLLENERQAAVTNGAEEQKGEV